MTPRAEEWEIERRKIFYDDKAIYRPVAVHLLERAFLCWIAAGGIYV
jgi:hypothetical protein